MNSKLFWLMDEQMAHLQPYFPKNHGRAGRWPAHSKPYRLVNRNRMRWRSEGAWAQSVKKRTLALRWRQQDGERCST